MPAYAHHGVTWGMTQPYLGKKLIKEETNERERMVSHLDYSTVPHQAGDRALTIYQGSP